VPAPDARVASPAPIDGGQHYLGLINVQYVPIHDVLQLTAQEREPFAASLKKLLGGRNPFAASVQRFDPEVPESVAIEKGKHTRFTMRGWMATYKTYAGLRGRPGAYATVQCKSDAEPGGWTERRSMQARR